MCAPKNKTEHKGNIALEIKHRAEVLGSVCFGRQRGSIGKKPKRRGPRVALVLKLVIVADLPRVGCGYHVLLN